jgi:serine/threonine-protein kinase
MLGDFGEVYVLDWGIAKMLKDARCEQMAMDEYSWKAQVRPSVERRPTAPFSILGTLAYAAPEQVMPGKARAVDPRTDVFALGAILFEILTWKRARKRMGSSEELLSSIAKTEDVSLDTADRGVPPALAAIYTRALQRDPGARYESVSDMVIDLERFLSESHARERLRPLSPRRLAETDPPGALDSLDAALAATADECGVPRGPAFQGAAPGGPSLASGTACAPGAPVLDDPQAGRSGGSPSLPPPSLPPSQISQSAALEVQNAYAQVPMLAIVSILLVILALLLGNMNVREWMLPVLVSGAGILSAGLRVASLLWPRSSRLPYAVHLMSLLFFVLFGRLLGSILSMIVLVAMDMFLQLRSPSVVFRRFAISSSCALVVGCLVLEWSGLYTAATLHGASALFQNPNILDRAPGLTYFVLLIVSLVASASSALGARTYAAAQSGRTPSPA